MGQGSGLRLKDERFGFKLGFWGAWGEDFLVCIGFCAVLRLKSGGAKLKVSGSYRKRARCLGIVCCTGVVRNTTKTSWDQFQTSFHFLYRCYRVLARIAARNLAVLGSGLLSLSLETRNCKICFK